MSRRPYNPRFFACHAAVLLLVLACGGGTARAQAEELDSLNFLRVHVPADRLSEVPLGTGRYVPMTLAEFRAAFADRAATATDTSGVRAATPARTLIADQAAYTLAWTPTEGFRGTAEVTLGPDIGGLRRAIPLGGQAVSQATFASAAGTGAAEICGLPDGTVAVVAEAEGTYGWQFLLPTSVGGQLGPVFQLPLVPAVFTSVELQLPAGFVPLVKGAEAVPAGAVATAARVVGPRGEGPPLMAWRLDLGPTSQLDGTIAAQPLPDVPLSCWSQIAIERQAVAITTSVLPAVPWTTTGVRLRVDSGVMVVAARLADERGTASVSWKPWMPADGGEQAEEPGMLVQLPRRVVGTRTPLIIESIAAFTIGVPARLPVVAAPAGLWAGGGLDVSIDPRLVVESFTPTGFLPVDVATVDGWPVAPVTNAPGLDAGPRLAFEAQASDAVMELTVAARKPEVQVRRVTTVDISAGSVMAQAACEVEVARGEIFELVARVAPGWLIDSVEIPSRTERPDWRVEPSGTGSLLRIGLVNGVAGGTEIRVNVMGHRGPLREGEPFAQASLEMLRLDDEQAAALEIRTNAEMTIDGAGQAVASVALEQVPSTLRRLAGDTGVRLRLLTSERDDGRMLRLLRRRPPIDVQTQVRLTVRDDRLTQSFTLECAPRDAEIDSVVVHLSEPTSDGMEWSLLPPTTGQLLARRLQPQEPRDPAHGMESWLLELVPSARGTITLRGVQTVPFTGPNNVPLAWVEGAASPVGELQIRDAGRRRPLVVNRTLSEIPGVVGESERYATSVSRFLFDPLRDLAGAQPAARLVPGDDEGGAPRAWAWNETTTCWCHTSGEIEYETVFDIENHGRSQIVLSHPPDKQIQEIRVDGVQLVAGVRQTLGGETVIELPAGRRMIRLEIRALASARSLLPGWQLAWQVDPVAGVIDLPVLERLWQVGVPPGLRIAHVPAMHHRLAEPQIGWVERLLGGSTRSLGAAEVSGELSPQTPAVVEGFRLYAFTPTSGRTAAAGLLLVSSQLVIATALILAMAMTLATWFFTRRSPAVAAAICGVAAVAALWAPQNSVEVVRAAWWGAALGLAMPMLGGRSRKSVVGGMLAAVLLVGNAGVVAAADGEVAGEPPLKVFFTGESEESTVLVPDRLFRELGRGIDAVETLGVRVERVTVVAAVPELAAGGELNEPAAWLLTVDLTSDSNTVCTLRQPAGGGRFLAGSLELDGSDPGEVLNESVSEDGRILRVPLAVPGRHRLSVQILPAVQAAGVVGMATIGIPVAPQAGLRLVETAAIDVAAVLVERERNGMPVQAAVAGPAEGTAGLLDVARSDTLRLCWPTEAGGKLTQEPKPVAARNDISWEAAGCIVVASFQFDPGDGVFRSFVVAADPRLEPALEELPEGSEPIAIRRIDEASWLVERVRPARGRATVSVPFRMPLADPVGVFRVPEVQLVSESSARATQLVQFIPAEGYVATARLPSGVTAVTPGDATSGSGWLAWRREPSATGGDGPAAVGVTVVREPTALRGTQRLRLESVDEAVRLRFDASLDSPDTALAALRVQLPAAWAVHRVGLARVTTPRSGALQATPQDIHWRQADDGTLEIVSQRPRSGRFRFDLEVHEPAGTAEVGELQIPRIEGLAETPVIVEWPTDGGVQVETGAADGAALLSASDWQSLERMPATMLAYRRGMPAVEAAATDDDDRRDAEEDDRLPPDLADAEIESPDGAPRVELLEVRFATDERGKAWGVARVDLVPTRRLVRMQLPAGMRLFEVFVDEHPLRARPVGEAAWELELIDVSRPRTIQVIFAGDIDEQMVSGRPLRLEPPKFPGIPTREVLWMIRGPRGLDMRLLAPSVESSAEVFEATRQQATARLKATLRRSLEGRDPQERKRVEEQVAAQLERSQLSAAEQAWNRTSLALSADVYATTTDADGGIIVRAAAKPTPTDSSRAVATAVAILAAGGAWSLAVRSPTRMTLLLVRFGPYAVLVLAAVWAALLTPTWPGVLIGVGAVVAIVRRLVAFTFRAEAAEGGLVIRDAFGDRGD